MYGELQRHVDARLLRLDDMIGVVLSKVAAEVTGGKSDLQSWQGAFEEVRPREWPDGRSAMVPFLLARLCLADRSGMSGHVVRTVTALRRWGVSWQQIGAVIEEDPLAARSLFEAVTREVTESRRMQFVDDATATRGAVDAACEVVQLFRERDTGDH